MTDRKKRRPKKLGDVMHDVLSRSGIADRVAQAAVIPEWRQLVGPQIARVTEPVSVTPTGTLFVSVTTNAWMTELSLMEPELLRRLNQRIGTAGRGASGGGTGGEGQGRRAIKKIRWQLKT